MASYKRIASLFVAASAMVVASSATVLAEPTTTTTQTQTTATQLPTTTTQVPTTTTTEVTTATQVPTTTQVTTTEAPLTTSTTAATRNVVLEVTGNGTVYGIEADPGGHVANENAPVPFRTSISVAPGTLVQIVATTKTGNQGCRITVNGAVVVSQAPGNPHCVYSVP